MSKYGLKRHYEGDGELCPRCGDSLKRFFRLHPFPLPAAYGKGTWLVSDCRCIQATRQKQREHFSEITQVKQVNPLPPALQGYTFSNFKVGEYNKQAFTYCTQFAQNFVKIKNGQGMLLYGRSGTGKTHLACAVVNHLRQSYWTAFTHVPTLLERIRTENMPLSTLLNVDLLVLDDLGSERASDWTLERLLIIVDGRLNNLKPTIFTANFDDQDLAQLDRRIGMRLASRILGSSLKVLVQGPDWRLQRQQAR